jgi:signal transduction histidine kinase
MLVSGPLGPSKPGWHLAISLEDDALFDAAAERKAQVYWWIAGAVIAGMAILGTLLARAFGQQTRLARLKTDLVTTVSHELKTPLTGMRAVVDTLLETEHLEETTTREYLRLLSRENARLSALIENFLTFSRLERNKVAFRFSPSRPDQLVDAAVTAMGERGHAPACRIETLVAPDLPLMNADREAITTALLNLLDNAWKYTGDEKRICLRADARNGSVLFAVEDNGVGIPAHALRRVFQRFYQVDQRLAREVGGCGLGLSIVQAIAKAHSGAVRVASEPGRGSVFTLEIPAVSA